MPSQYYFISVFLICFHLSTHVHAVMDNRMRTQLLSLHNTARAAVRNGQLSGQPIAVSMKLLNTELEMKAQFLSDQCRFGHDTNNDRKTSQFPYVGQNWAGSQDIETGFQLWLDEYKYYDFNTGTCHLAQCAHYTQIVWENTTDIGCGVSNCPNIPYKLSIVCNYGPA
ncbi:Venom allergen 5 [Schistosoma japonicum]|nr:Venom allergen 5 [Schistosoma japonicum]